MDISSITKRQPLNPDDVLYLNGEKCIINAIKGTGTSSIVYEATLDGRKIILKELYPYGLGIFRNKDNSLIIPKNKENDFQSYKDGLNKAYQTQLNFHNDHKVRNFTVEPQKLYKHNNTLYVVMHLANGTSYDLIEPENVLSILEVGKALSKVISYYHEKGFLNLDIKPGNIFVFPETNQLIQLFDFDTVSSKEEILKGEFSYSEGYEAPEVSGSYNGLFSFSDIDERADIYSIGAVIFEKIMGRVPDFSDQRNGKVWDFSHNSYLKDTVPQLQKEIFDLFRKTIARRKENRYSSAKDLISDLEKLIKLAGVEVFLKNQRISPCAPKDIYISRSSILSDIAKRLNEHGILYLYALGGSGKSETAREYAEKYGNKYDFIQSVFYKDSLKKTIADLDFVGLEDKDRFAYTDEEIDRLYKYKYGLLGNKDLYGTNTLLIIDNYNYSADPASEEYQQNFKIIKELKKLNIHILFTTRIRPSYSTECLELENLTPDKLRSLFFKINPTDKDKPERIDLVNEIIEVSYKHTMTVKLIAMQSKKYKRTLKDYLDILKSNGLKSGITGRITNEKDDETVTMPTVYDHIKALFDFDDLNDKQKYIMVNACLLPLSGLEVSTFSQYTDLENFDTESSDDCEDESIEDLINSGWIAYADPEEKDFTSETKITLHPLICDIITNELEPELTEDKCRKFYISFLDLIQEWGNEKSNLSKFEHDAIKIYSLFPKINNILLDVNKQVITLNKQKYKWIDNINNYNKPLSTINYIFLSNQNIKIQNHAVLFNDELVIYFGIEETFIIPDNIVTIKDSAFCNCFNLKHISIPNNVKYICQCSFSNCFQLKELIIPDSVIKIEGWAFEGCSSLTKIIIPDSVKEIGQSAFSNCSSLIEIIISKSINIIRDWVFAYCSSLTNIIIPDSVTKIEPGAFSNCSSLSNITIPDSVKEIENSVFSHCTSLTQITVPDSIIVIRDWLFIDCTSLTKITIPNSVTKIGNSAFENCSSLTTIAIPDSVTEIGESAFEGCSSLKKLIIPENVDKIGNKAFSDCSSLTRIKLPNSITEFGSQVFKGCQSIEILGNITNLKNNDFFSLTEITIPDGVTKIENGYFKDCSSLQKIIIPESVTKIEDRAFYGCSSLSEIIIPNSVTEIGEGAFYGCSSLSNIVIPDSIIKISNNTFRDCSSLSNIIIPDGVTEIGSLSFSNCSSLTQITLPESVTKIGDNTFTHCSSLPKIILPNNIIKIGYMAFFGCYSLNEIHIPDNVKEIGDWLFAGCYSLTEITIPNSITKIGGAFYGCSSLTKITIPNTIKDIGGKTFFLCSSLTQIKLPDYITKIRSATFYGCSSLTNIIIPNSVDKIGENAFEGCFSITEITVPSSVKKIEKNAFKDCNFLKIMIFLNPKTYIHELSIGYCINSNGLYIKNRDLTIKGYKNSTAEKYAQENGLKFVSLD